MGCWQGISILAQCWLFVNILRKDVDLRAYSTRTAFAPLPVFWPYGKFRGRRIDSLPPHYAAWAMRRPFPTPYKSALRAVEGFQQLAADQREGR